MAFLIPMAFAFVYVSRGWRRLAWLLSILLFTLVLLFSVSRGGLAGLVGGGILTGILVRRYIDWRIAGLSVFVFLAVGLASIAILAPTQSDLLYERFVESTQSIYVHDVTSMRTEIWADGLAEMTAKPLSLLFGFGWDTWELRNDWASHNEYLKWYFELGLLGLIFFTFVLFYIPFRVARSLSSVPEDTRAILIGFLMGYLAILIVIFFLNPSKIWLYIWAVTGLSLRIASETSDSRSVRV
jgi:O-antigen ligase